MTDDDLLLAIGRVARDKERAREAEEALPPIDQAARDRIVERILAEQRRQRRRARILAAAGAGVVAAAAVIAVLLLAGRRPAALPRYELALVGGDSPDRSPAPLDAPPRLAPGSRLEIVIRPEQRVSGSVELRTYLAPSPGPLSLAPWDAPVERSPDGAFRIAGARETLFPTTLPGTWELIFVVGRPGAMPTEADVARALEGPAPGGSRSWWVMRGRVILVGLALAVEVAGCAALRTGPVCELPEDGRLRLWVHAGVIAEVRLASGGRDLDAPSEPVQGGRLYRIQLPSGARELSVTARPGERTSWRLALAPRANEPALARAEELRRSGDLDQAEQQLAALDADLRVDVQAQVAGKRARIAMARCRTQDECRAVTTSFRRAIELDRESGRISDEWRDSLALAYFLLYRQRELGEARAILTALADRITDPEGNAHTHYYLEALSSEVGDLRAALRHARDGEAAAERLGMVDLMADLSFEQADLLRRMGRPQEGEALLAKPLPPAPPCTHAERLVNLGWFELQREDAAEDPARLARAIARTEEALAIFRDECARPASLANAWTNLAIGALLGGQHDRTLAHLAEARRAQPDAAPHIQVWWLDLEARVALERGRPAAALTTYEGLAALADAALLPEARVSAALGRARALEALGRLDEAERGYDDADRLVAELVRFVPLGEGRESFLARHEVTPMRLAFLVGRRRLLEAVDCVRRSRGLLLGTLAIDHRIAALPPERRAEWERRVTSYRREREALDLAAAGDWRVPSSVLRQRVEERRAQIDALRARLDEALALLGPRETGDPLPPPAPGELMLLYHPAPKGWIGLGAQGDRIVAHAIAVDPSGTPEQLAGRLLAPFDDEIERAERIRIVASGALARIDFHALPWRGEPLVAARALSYGGALPPPGATPPASLAAVVVADPRGDLPGARRELQAAEARLGRDGWTVDPLVGEDATHPAVRDALERSGARLFHYAGHGRFQGRDGWQSELPLAAGGWLTIGDVLALSRVPDVVVLSGCDTARSASLGSTEGLGLAGAFLLRGARYVVAAVRPVDDRLAARFTEALYDAGLSRAAGSREADIPTAVAAAQLAIYREAPDQDWASFRLLVR